MGIEKLVEMTVKENDPVEQVVETSVEAQATENVTPEPVQPEKPVEVAASIKDLTKGRFEKLEDLYTEYSTLEEKLKTQEPSKYEFRDDYIKGLVERYEKGEDLTPYLRAKTLNLDSMSPEDLLRMDLKEKYPKATAKDLDRLYKKHVIDKFNLDPDQYDEDEISVGRMEMDKVAEAVRNEYLEKLKPFLQPEPAAKPEGETQEPKDDPAKLEAEMMERFKQFEETIRNNTASKSLLEKKVFEIPTVDGEKFNLEVEAPEELLEQAIYSDKFYKNFEGEEGPDLNKFFMVSQFAKDPSKFIELLVQHGKELGKAQVLQEIENPSEPDRKAPSKEMSPWEKLFSSAT